jgi:hypothetical protein
VRACACLPAPLLSPLAPTCLPALQIPQRFLMGPGPGNAHPRILASQSLPLLGHMHPPFLKARACVPACLRGCFGLPVHTVAAARLPACLPYRNAPAAEFCCSLPALRPAIQEWQSLPFGCQQAM